MCWVRLGWGFPNRLRSDSRCVLGWRPACMAPAYSMDLRDRVVAAVETGGLSRHEAAIRFGIGVSTAIRWVASFRRTGSVAPGQMGGHKPRRLVGAHRDWLMQRCAGQAFTLRGLVAELAARGLKVDYRSVWTFVHEEKLSFKKNFRGSRTGPPRRRSATGAVASVST